MNNITLLKIIRIYKIKKITEYLSLQRICIYSIIISIFFTSYLNFFYYTSETLNVFKNKEIIEQLFNSIGLIKSFLIISCSLILLKTIALFIINKYFEKDDIVNIKNLIQNHIIENTKKECNILDEQQKIQVIDSLTYLYSEAIAVKIRINKEERVFKNNEGMIRMQFVNMYPLIFFHFDDENANHNFCYSLKDLIRLSSGIDRLLPYLSLYTREAINKIINQPLNQEKQSDGDIEKQIEEIDEYQNIDINEENFLLQEKKVEKLIKYFNISKFIFNSIQYFICFFVLLILNFAITGDKFSSDIISFIFDRIILLIGIYIFSMFVYLYFFNSLNQLELDESPVNVYAYYKKIIHIKYKNITEEESIFLSKYYTLKTLDIISELSKENPDNIIKFMKGWEKNYSNEVIKEWILTIGEIQLKEIKRKLK